MRLPRFPFADAIADPRLLKTAWGTFSKEQQSVCRMIYGLPLDNEDMAIWHALHNGGTYDDLYTLVNVHDSGVAYIEGREYTDVTLIIGRRAAKTCIGDFLLSYEALCGGHKSRLQMEDQEPIFLQVAQDLGSAIKGMRGYTLSYLKSSPAGRAALGDLQYSVTQRSIKLAGCGTISVGPPNIKVGRGDSIPCAVMDEIAYWQSDLKSAAPDEEVEKAIEYGMSQFSPYDKRIKLSTPYTEEGLLWKTQQIGTHGRFVKDPTVRAGLTHKLVLQGPSPLLKNPTITRVFLTEKRAKDPTAFDREIGAKFSKSVSGYLAPALIARAVADSPHERPPVSGVYYVAAIDPALKHDAFPLSIGHMEQGGVFVQDLLRSWQGSRENPLDPGIIMGLVGQIVTRYGCRSVMSDQHESGSLQSLAMHEGFSLEAFVLTHKTKGQVWKDFLNLLTQDKLRLLDHPHLVQELHGLERILSPTHVERIAGKRDDHAIVTAMCVHRALQFGIAAPKKGETCEATTAEGIAAVLKARASKVRLKQRKVGAWWNR